MPDEAGSLASCAFTELHRKRGKKKRTVSDVNQEKTTTEKSVKPKEEKREKEAEKQEAVSRETNSQPLPPDLPKPATQTKPPSPGPEKLKDTPSIFNRKKSPDKSLQDSASVLDKKSEEFSEEALQSAWKKFGENRSMGDTDRLILNREVNKGEEFSVMIHLASQLEVSFLEKLEVALIQHLRTELKNDHITLKREILQEEESKKLYTSKDIFDYMVKQNPNLKDLKDRLGLDFDY